MPLNKTNGTPFEYQISCILLLVSLILSRRSSSLPLHLPSTPYSTLFHPSYSFPFFEPFISFSSLFVLSHFPFHSSTLSLSLFFSVISRSHSFPLSSPSHSLSLQLSFLLFPNFFFNLFFSFLFYVLPSSSPCLPFFPLLLLSFCSSLFLSFPSVLPP